MCVCVFIILRKQESIQKAQIFPKPVGTQGKNGFQIPSWVFALEAQTISSRKNSSNVLESTVTPNLGENYSNYTVEQGLGA